MITTQFFFFFNLYSGQVKNLKRYRYLPNPGLQEKLIMVAPLNISAAKLSVTVTVPGSQRECHPHQAAEGVHLLPRHVVHTPFGSEHPKV